MAYTIAVAGKGGVGKTTVAGLLVRYLVEHDMKPVLAVDADPNTNLNEVLGVEVELTLGDAREEMKTIQAQQMNMTKDMFIEMRLNQCLVESKGFDLIAMGRPEGPGCYCAANHLLTQCMDRLAENYSYIVVDNEAGMEHISRVTTQRVDLLLVVSDPSKRGLTAAARVQALAKEVGILAGASWLVMSMVRGQLPEAMVSYAEAQGLKLAGAIPEDEELMRWDMEGKPTARLPEDNAAVKAAFEIFAKVLGENEGKRVFA